MHATSPFNVEDLSRQIRELWRREPAVPESQRTELMVWLQELRTGLEHLQQRVRADRIDADEYRRTTEGFAAEIDQLRSAWG